MISHFLLRIPISPSIKKLLTGFFLPPGSCDHYAVKNSIPKTHHVSQKIDDCLLPKLSTNSFILWILMDLNHLLRIFSPPHRPSLPRIQLVPTVGLEPTRLWHQCLKLEGLPIPPSGLIYFLVYQHLNNYALAYGNLNIISVDYLNHYSNDYYLYGVILME